MMKREGRMKKGGGRREGNEGGGGWESDNICVRL